MALNDIKHVVNGNADFAKNFYRIVSKEDGNIFFSPLSAHVILAMVYQGATENTAKQFANTLSIPDCKVAANEYNILTKAFNEIQNVTLHMANKIFLADGFRLKETFEKAATQLFLSEIETINFDENVKAADKINQWVEEKTDSKIKNLLSSSSLNKHSRLVLVNAIYFKGDWEYKFDKGNTKTAPFYITRKDKVDCQMMNITTIGFNYRDDQALDAKIIQLPYKNKNVSMVAILPNSINGIVKLEQKLLNVDLTTLTKSMRYDEVELSLPKFRIETTMDLKPILKKMGLGVIFDKNNAEFSEIVESKERLYVSEVVQKAFIEVNEEGAEAAASTSMQGSWFSGPFKFIADHPFIVILQVKHEDTINILFYGKVVNPGCVAVRQGFRRSWLSFLKRSH